MEQALDRICSLELKYQQELKAAYRDIQSSYKDYHASLDKLYKRRQELISGKGTPTAEELAEYTSHDSTTTQAAAHKGVPYFWLNAMYNQDIVAEEINSRDKLALAYCTSVKAVHHSGGGPPTLEMSFSSNPFFTNNMLRRRLGDQELGVPEVTTDIQWKDTAHNLTVKAVKRGGGKKGKKGKGKAGAEEDDSSSSVRVKPCSSFFRFFLPEGDSSSRKGKKIPKQLYDPVALHDEDYEEDEVGEEAAGTKSAKRERDELLMRLILEEVLPRATDLYRAGPLQSLDSEEEEEGDGYQLVHGAAGLDPSELPEQVQVILAALRHNQQQINTLTDERQQLRAKAKQEEVKLREQLAEQRRSMLLPSGNSCSIPRFWLRVLRSADTAALAISPRDAAVLANLADVRFSLSSPVSDGSGGKELHGRLELEFLPNPYLAPSTLTLIKEYSFDTTSSGDLYLLHSKVTTAPTWSSADKDPTVKKSKDGKQRPASSVFQLFKQGGGKYAFNLTGLEKDVQEEANELETELVVELHGRLMVDAGSIYKQLAQEHWAEDDSADGDQAVWQQQAAEIATDDDTDDDEGDVEEDVDEGEAAHKAAARRAKHKQQGWRVTKAGVLIGMIVLMLLAELFVFMDMTGLFRSRR